MGREYHNRLRLDLGRYLAPDLGKLEVCRVLDIVHDVWLMGIKSEFSPY